MATAAATAVPALRHPLIAYVVALIGLTRVLFGAHFALDVVVGVALGHEVGLFAARLMASAGLLPAPAAARRLAAVPSIAPSRS
jgi:membrane-associated phospholipid phosphatase